MFHYRQTLGDLNDPNGPCYWHGRYHLFYQHIFDGIVSWGHAVSTDLIQWEELPDVILPISRSTPGEPGYSGAQSCWSGAVCIDGDRVFAAFYGHGDDPAKVGIYVMTSEDPMLRKWQNVTDGAVMLSIEQLSVANTLDKPYPYASVPYCTYPMLYDPCIWKEDGVFHILTGGVVYNETTGGLRRQEFLFTSTDLVHWEYRHPMIADDSFGEIGDDGGCPYFVKWEDDKTPGEDHRLLWHLSHQLGPRYVMGTYDKAALKFTPYSGSRVQTVSSFDGYTVPALFTNMPDHSVAAIYIMRGRGTPTVMSMPHRLERCGEHLEEIAVSPAFDVDSLPCTRTPAPGEESCIRPEGATAIYKMHIGYDGDKAFPVLKFHRKDGAVFGSLKLHVGSGGNKRKNQEWFSDDLAVLSMDDRPDSAPPQSVRLPRTAGIWDFTLVLDEDVLEIFYPNAHSMGQRIYGDLDGIYLTLENGVILP